MQSGVEFNQCFPSSVCEPGCEEAVCYSWHGAVENPNGGDRAQSVWIQCLFCLQGDILVLKMY